MLRKELLIGFVIAGFATVLVPVWVWLLAVFWAVMSAAGLAVEYLFTPLGLVPTTRPTLVAMEGVSWNYTTILNIIALVGFAVLYWLYRNRERFGGGIGYAKDPVCGVQVEKNAAPDTVVRNGRVYYFCSDHCQHRFTATDQHTPDHPHTREDTR